MLAIYQATYYSWCILIAILVPHFVELLLVALFRLCWSCPIERYFHTWCAHQVSIFGNDGIFVKSGISPPVEICKTGQYKGIDSSLDRSQKHPSYHQTQSYLPHLITKKNFISISCSDLYMQNSKRLRGNSRSKYQLPNGSYKCTVVSQCSHIRII